MCNYLDFPNFYTSPNLHVSATAANIPEWKMSSVTAFVEFKIIALGHTFVSKLTGGFTYDSPIPKGVTVTGNRIGIQATGETVIVFPCGLTLDIDIWTLKTGVSGTIVNKTDCMGYGIAAPTGMCLLLFILRV